jgi:hypothetical protein
MQSQFVLSEHRFLLEQNMLLAGMVIQGHYEQTQLAQQIAADERRATRRAQELELKQGTDRARHIVEMAEKKADSAIRMREVDADYKIRLAEMERKHALDLARLREEIEAEAEAAAAQTVTPEDTEPRRKRRPSPRGEPPGSPIDALVGMVGKRVMDELLTPKEKPADPQSNAPAAPPVIPGVPPQAGARPLGAPRPGASPRPAAPQPTPSQPVDMLSQIRAASAQDITMAMMALAPQQLAEALRTFAQINPDRAASLIADVQETIEGYDDNEGPDNGDEDDNDEYDGDEDVDDSDQDGNDSGEDEPEDEEDSA